MTDQQRIKLKQQCLNAARYAIEHEQTVAFDVCAERCQMLANVKHMRWTLMAVANELIATENKYKELDFFE